MTEQQQQNKLRSINAMAKLLVKETDDLLMIKTRIKPKTDLEKVLERRRLTRLKNDTHKNI
jgi:hypothetical protein